MTVLGIESSCDETGAAVVKDGKLLSNVVASSLDLHIPFGGVVPEIAARSHVEVIIPVIEQALKESKTDWAGIDAIAVTQGPGLLGSLLIGVVTARTLAIAKKKPLYAVNHVEAHVYAAFLQEQRPQFPLLSLIVSGGHTQLVLFRDHFNYKVLGRTGDDAVGEAFDKVAKILGLPYPGGPSVSEAAKKGDSKIVALPEAKMANRYDFSFSGLKTAVLRAAQSMSGNPYDFPSSKLPNALSDTQKADLAASFQATAVETLVSRLNKAEEEFKPKSVIIAGGVAANGLLRERATEQLSAPVIYPDIKLCTDNAAMVAALGGFMASHKRPVADPYSLEPDPGLEMKITIP
ncbi:MAG TPA: tRNA (adenosine(37)-N6)-threonylcarbamoyltransferase complex transferase subunit TsaD [Candidatus Saccharimonadales bacterium]|nr:tRNA (adenosine(37)-N6)-threonylcarbamoyltransferase complex transferase subunit TsaD [Candidatus Saccharimonadales bacterium]